MAEDPFLKKLPNYSKIVEKRVPEIKSKQVSEDVPIGIFNDTLKRPEAVSIRRPSSIAQDLKEDMAGFGTADTIVEHFQEINEKNAPDVLESYQKSFGKSLMHDIAREYEAGGLTLEARTACIKNLKNMLVNNIRKGGFDAPQLFDDFDKELEKQKNSFGRISTEKLDELTNKMLDIISSNKELKEKYPEKFFKNRFNTEAEEYKAGDEYGFYYKEDDGARNISISNGYRESKQCGDGSSFSYRKQYSEDRKSVTTEYLYSNHSDYQSEKNISTASKNGVYKTTLKEISNKKDNYYENNLCLTSPGKEKINIKMSQKNYNGYRRETERNGLKYTIYTIDDMLKVEKHNSNEAASLSVSEFVSMFKPEEASQVKNYLNSLNGDVLFDVIAALHSKEPSRCSWVKSLVANEGLGKSYDGKLSASNNDVWDKYCNEYKTYYNNSDKINVFKDGAAIYNACYSIIMTGKSVNENIIYEHFPETLIEMKKHLDDIHSYQLPFMAENNISVN